MQQKHTSRSDTTVHLNTNKLISLLWLIAAAVFGESDTAAHIAFTCSICHLSKQNRLNRLCVYELIQCLSVCLLSRIHSSLFAPNGFEITRPVFCRNLIGSIPGHQKLIWSSDHHSHYQIDYPRWSCESNVCEAKQHFVVKLATAIRDWPTQWEANKLNSSRIYQTKAPAGKS